MQLATALLAALLLAFSTAVAATSNTATVYVASVRFVDALGTLAARPADAMRYAAHQVVAPSSHRKGRISRYFESIAATQFVSRSGFTDAIVDQSRDDFGTSEVLVFVHGFDNSFTESLDRTAQLAMDLDIPAATVLFAWPSANRLHDYARDVKQLPIARQGLAELLHDLALSDASRIVLVAHSLGARLALETLGDMHVRGADVFFQKFGGLAMLAPDIPVGQFNSTMKQLPDMAGKMVVYASSRDRVFQLAPTIAGIRGRLGDLRQLEGLGDAEIIVVDVGEVSDHALFHHFPVVTSPTLINAINGLEHPDFIYFAHTLARGGLSTASVSTIGEATVVVLPQPPRL